MVGRIGFKRGIKDTKSYNGQATVESLYRNEEYFESQ